MRFRRMLAVALGSLAIGAAAPAGAAVAAARPPVAAAQSETGTVSLESAAAKAGATARTVAMSLIGLAFAVAGATLAFRRDFKDAAGVFVVGIIAVLFASPAGVSLIRDTVNSLFG